MATDENWSKVIKYRQAIYGASSLEEKLQILKEAYQFAKSIASSYDPKSGFYGYNNISKTILECERAIPMEFIIENKPKMSNLDIKDSLADIKEDEVVLDKIVSEARKELLQDINIFLARKLTLDKCDLTNHCLNTSRFIEKYCRKNYIACICKVIEPGYIKHSRLYEGFGCHAFCIARINDHDYLIDATYSQFFQKGRSMLDRIGIPKVPSSNVGVFMLMDERRKKVAEKLLTDGYILLTDEVLKDYLDGFTIFFRNGLYYEKTDDFSYTTNYSAEDYKKFLSGEDSQIRHEDLETLGYMKRTLQNPNLDFSKR